MIKRRIATLAFALLLLMSGGCSLADIDEEKAAEIENSKTIIEYNDTDVTKLEVTLAMNQFLMINGSSVESIKSSGDDQWNSFKESFLKQMSTNLIALDKAREMGLDQLTEEEKTSLDQSYDATMAMLDSIIAPAVKSTVEDDPAIDYDTEYQKQLKRYLNMIGYEPETYRASLEKEFILSKVQEELLKDITVTDDDVRSNYDANVKMQKNNIDISPDSVEMQLQFGGSILYYPAGYMKVRHILISFDVDTKSKALAAYPKEDKTEYNQIISDALLTIQSRIDEVLSKMDSGEDFATLIDDYNDDSTMDSEPARTEGSAVGPYSSSVTIPGYIDAVAKLAKPGDYTLLNTYTGCYIIRCEKLLEGAVPFDEVKDSIKANLLAERQSSEWSTITSGWIDEATSAGKLKMYPDRY